FWAFFVVRNVSIERVVVSLISRSYIFVNYLEFRF
ncbi:MAG: hypothetical protein ACI976_000020, partial [Aureispira sp.]